MKHPHHHIADLYKPNLRKISVFVFLLFLTILIPKTEKICTPTKNGPICEEIPLKGIGYPVFYTQDHNKETHFDTLNFFINFIIFYFASCLLENKMKKRKN
ncbi:hypothetical protein H6501_05405 [Candidatus Woesearchaeota archaeon]|nr:hypothetical protein [Candidatus Woesearchaeota archaeon]